MGGEKTLELTADYEKQEALMQLREDLLLSILEFRASESFLELLMEGARVKLETSADPMQVFLARNIYGHYLVKLAHARQSRLAVEQNYGVYTSRLLAHR
jgi:primosomal protein N'